MEKIIGNTIEQKNQLSFKDNLAYAAGETVVYYSYKTNEQRYFAGQAKVNAVLISRDGTHLFTGEQSFKNPAVNIYNLWDSQYQLSGHKLGIQQLLESPSQPYLFSLGTEQDKYLILWNWKEKKKLASNRLSKQVYSIQFNPKGTLLVSAGEGHLKYWHFASDGKALCDDNTLQPRSFTLQEQFALKTYVDCVVKDRLFTITQDALMCLFSLSNKSMIQWINLNVENVYSLAHNDQYVICSGSNQTIRIFNNQLQHQATLPKLSNQQVDCITIQLYNQLLISGFKNRILIIWDISDINSITKVQVITSHCNSITNLKVLPNQSSVDVTFFLTITEEQQFGLWHTNNNIQGIKSDCQNTIILKDLKQNQNSENISCLNVSNDGKYLAIGDQLGFLRIMSLIDFEIISVIKAHSQKITCISFSQSIVSSGSDDQNIQLFDDKFNPNGNLKGHKAPILKILFVKDIIISCSTDKQIIYWEKNNSTYKQASSFMMANFISQIETDGKHLFVIQEKLISIYEVQEQVCKYTLEIDNCIKVFFKTFIESQMIILLQKNNLKILKHQNGQLQLIEDVAQQNIQTFEITADNKQLIMAGSEGCIYFQKLKWQPQPTVPKLIDLFKANENSNRMKWIISNLWDEAKLKSFLKLDDEEEIGIITFESDDEQEKPSNEFNKVIQTLGQEIQSQFQNNMNQVLKSYKESAIVSTFKENEELLRNPFYEEQQNMQEFQRRQNSNILKKMKLKSSEVKADIKQNSEIALPFQSQLQSKLPEFPKLQQMEFKSIISSTISKSPYTNRFKSKFDIPQQNSIILNCSYMPSERNQFTEDEIESQYVYDLKAKLVITIDQSSKMSYSIDDYGIK